MSEEALMDQEDVQAGSETEVQVDSTEDASGQIVRNDESP